MIDLRTLLGELSTCVRMHELGDPEPLKRWREEWNKARAPDGTMMQPQADSDAS